MPRAKIEITGKPIFVRLPPDLEARFRHQAERLSCTMGALSRIAISRLVESEEAVENANRNRGT